MFPLLLLLNEIFSHCHYIFRYNSDNWKCSYLSISSFRARDIHRNAHTIILAMPFRLPACNKWITAEGSFQQLDFGRYSELRAQRLIYVKIRKKYLTLDSNNYSVSAFISITTCVICHIFIEWKVFWTRRKLIKFHTTLIRTWYVQTTAW